MADSGVNDVVISSSFSAKLMKWRVTEGQIVKERSVLALYEKLDQSVGQKGFITQPKLKSSVNGRVGKLLVAEGDVVLPGKPVIVIEQTAVCEHQTVMKDLCCDCGMDLRKLQNDPDEPSSPTSATVSMIHNIPELKVSKNEAEAVGKKDEERLLSSHKLALVVDLDQTMIHTTIELVPADMKDVFHFNLAGYPVWYHTKFRPFAHDFLEKISKLYELHIFTMGSRLYAHTIARMLDPDESLFAHRIRSRDDCFNGFSKSNDLRSLFPRGDSMVCIIDDRTDVWNNAPNLIQVKAYQFFKGVGDINAPTDKQREPATSTEKNAVELENQKKDSSGEIKEDEGSTDEKKDDEAKLESGKEVVKPLENGGAELERDTEEMETRTCVFQEDENKNCSTENKKVVDCPSDCEVIADAPKDMKEDDCVQEENDVDLKKGAENEVGEEMKTDVDTSQDCTSGSCIKENDIGEELCISEENGTQGNKEDKSKVTEIRFQEKEGINGEKETAEENKLEEEQTKESEAKENERKEQEERKSKVTDKSGSQEKEDLDVEKKDTPTADESGNIAIVKNDDHDDYLVHLEDILRRIHHKFYNVVDQIKKLKSKELKENPSTSRYCSPGTLTPCTKQIIKELRLQVLKGVKVAFTGVIPTNIQPEKSEIWLRAEELGAKPQRHVVCPKDATDPADVTTHVIAARLGTEKTYRAIKTPGMKLVKPGWLWSCTERWEWVDERLFPVDGIEKYKKDVRKQRTPQGTPQSWKGTVKNYNRKDSKQNNESESEDEDEVGVNPVEGRRERTVSSSSADILMASIHPLLSFSSTEMEAMDKEVEDLMNSSADESDVIGSISGSSGSSSSSSNSSSSSSSSEESGEKENVNEPLKKRKRNLSEGESVDILTKKIKKGATSESEELEDRLTPSDDDDCDDDDDDDDNDDDTSNDMAALLEAELTHC